MAKIYEPPKQSGIGQVFDAIVLLVLVYVVLFAPLVMGLTGGGTVVQEPEAMTWEALGQNAVMQAQWEKLGYTVEDAAPLITEKFDYTIDPVMLAITGAVILGYFIFMLTMSAKEYREVIAEKFGTNDDRNR